MVIGILLIVLTILNILLIILGIRLLFTSYYFYSIVFLMISIGLYLIIFIIFSKETNKQLEKEKQILKSLMLTNLIHKENGVNVVGFELKNNKWVSEKDDNISFELENYLFKKSFIIARIIRELRYPIVSNQLYLSKLLSFKLKIKKYDNLVVRFTDGDKIKKISIVKSYISKNTCLSYAISKSKYYDLYLSNRSYSKYMRKIENINENIYLD